DGRRCARPAPRAGDRSRAPEEPARARGSRGRSPGRRSSSRSRGREGPRPAATETAGPAAGARRSGTAGRRARGRRPAPSTDRRRPPRRRGRSGAGPRGPGTAHRRRSAGAPPLNLPVPGRVLVLVVAPQPEDLLALLLPPDRRPIEQAVVPHHGLETAGGGHIGAVDGAVGSDVRAEARTLRDVAAGVDAASARVLLDDRGDLTLEKRLQLLPGVLEAEIAVEVRADGGDPIETPAHPLPV